MKISDYQEEVKRYKNIKITLRSLPAFTVITWYRHSDVSRVTMEMTPLTSAGGCLHFRDQ